MTWSHLSLQARSTYTFATDLELTISHLMMRFASTMEAETIDLTVHDFHLEGGAHLDVSGRGPAAGTGKQILKLTITSWKLPHVV